MTRERRRNSTARDELDLYCPEHMGATLPDEFARKVLSRRRRLHNARRLFARYPVAWRIVQRLAWHLLDVEPDRQVVDKILGEALVNAIDAALYFDAYHRERGIEAELQAFYHTLLQPMNGVLPAERLVSLASVRDPWMEDGDTHDVEDEAVNQLKARMFLPREQHD